ncbi:MAG: hypothetical protein DCO96_04835 [Fluviicola sp. XM-24bin1]|nr:MAG: hypothetical protein DCO96_04835 [Fluviicola sp. XM-24bin1]
MKVTIKEPCSANWDEMKIGLISRHCAQCDKSVMDFTQMDRGEIIAYLLSNPSESTCGRMRRDQFDFKHEDIPVLVEAIRKHRPSNPFLIIALVSMSLASCSSEPTGEIKTPPAVIQQVDDNTGDKIDTTNVDPISDPIEDTTETIVKAPVPIPPPPPPPVGMIEMGEIMPIPEPDPEPIYEPEPFIEEDTEDDRIYEIVEEMPEFPGGVSAMMQFISDNLNYPKSGIDQGIEGNTYVQFVVEKDGSLADVTILRSLGPGFDTEVNRIMSKMPNWTPGKQRNKEVRCKMRIPIRFVLS